MVGLNDLKSFITAHKRTFKVKGSVAGTGEWLITRLRRSTDDGSVRPGPDKQLPYHSVLHDKLNPGHPLLHTTIMPTR